MKYTFQTAIIIAAAGSGTRFGSELPKQFCLLGDKPVVIHAIERCRAAVPDAEIVVVVSADRVAYFKEICGAYGLKELRCVIGGATRWESVKNALDVLSQTVKMVMIHDGARPLVQKEVMDRMISAMAKGAEGVLPVMPMTDSLRHKDADGDSHAVDRSRYVAVQTPQAFDCDKLRAAYALPYRETMTDDASVMEAAGYKDIRLCAGSEATFKITRPLDIEIASLYLKM